MTVQPPAEQIALAADRLRDMAAAGLRYAEGIYDHERYQAIQQIALELLALANGDTLAAFEPLRATIFARSSPLLAGAAAVIDDEGMILLQRRADNGLWNMPGGVMEVGETPAQAVVRELLEETGLRCQPIALVGVYDNRYWEPGVVQHMYKLTFLCASLDGRQPVQPPSHALETAELGWFAEHNLPTGLFEGHRQRITDAFRAWRGEPRAYFDRPG